MKTLRFAIFVAAVAVAALSQAQNLVGKWHGHIKVNQNFLKNMPPANATKFMRLEKVQPELNLKKDKTFTLVQTLDGRSQAQEGTYTFDRTSLTLNVTKIGGRPSTRSASQTFKIVGKSLTFVGPAATATFTR